MIKMFQKRWFNIEFKDICALSSKEIATTEFYKLFYQIFYDKYSSWDSLPASYIAGKQHITKHLAEIISQKQPLHVLSIGCGNGVVEKQLLKIFPELHMVAYEPDEINLKWLKQVPGVTTCFGEFPQCIPKQEYDLVYLSGVDPVLNDKSYISFLSHIKSLTSAPVILTNVIKPYPNPLAFVKYWTKFWLAQFNLYDLGQFWGYLRHLNEHTRLIRKAGYQVKEIGDISNGLRWIEINPQNT